jgi:hypothetical protein
MVSATEYSLCGAPHKLYTADARCLSRAPTLDAFLDRYRLLIGNCAGALRPGGKLAILMGDYCNREETVARLVQSSGQPDHFLGNPRESPTCAIKREDFLGETETLAKHRRIQGIRASNPCFNCTNLAARP